MRTFLSAIAVALALPAAAAAGGWATAGLAPPGDGLAPGDTWRAEITLLQHGVTPLEHVEPAVILLGGDGTRTRFPAAPTGEPGVYVADVPLPAAGTYRFQVDDGFSQVHTFAPFALDEPAGDGGFPAWAIALLAAGGALAAALTALALLRRARPGRVAVPVG